MRMRTFRITEWRDLVQRGLRCTASANQKLKVANRSMRRMAAPLEKGPFSATPFGVSKNREPRMPLGFPKLTLFKVLRAETPPANPPGPPPPPKRGPRGPPPRPPPPPAGPPPGLPLGRVILGPKPNVLVSRRFTVE